MLRVGKGVPLSPGPALGLWHFELDHAMQTRHRLIQQQGDYLCWAACAAMLDAAQPDPQGVSQCEIAARALGKDCCDGARPAKRCDVPLDQVEITNVLNEYCPDAEAVLYPLEEDELQDELLSKQRAVQVRWKWSGAGAVDAHVVLVVAADFEPAKATIYTVLDPKYFSARLMTYEQLRDAEGRGSWAESWIGL